MRALVTGVAGFIGSNLARRLRAEGFDVTGVDAFTDYYDRSLKKANAASVVAAGADVIDADLNDVDLDQLLGGTEVIFHLAGQPGVRASWGSEFAAYTHCNISATQRLLEAVRDKPDIRRFVFASSSSVYGDAERYPTTEQDRPQPVSPYGVTKLAAEHLCTLYATNFGVPTVSLRYFTVYGPGQRPDMAFTRFARAAISDENIYVYGTGEQTRDFTYVDDVAEANLRAATTETPPGSVFNVAGGSHSSVNDVLNILEQLADKKLSVVRQDPIAGDVKCTGGETTAIRSVLGWQPRVDLREGLARQLAWAAETMDCVAGR